MSGGEREKDEAGMGATGRKNPDRAGTVFARGRAVAYFCSACSSDGNASGLLGDDENEEKCDEGAMEESGDEGPGLKGKSESIPKSSCLICAVSSDGQSELSLGLESQSHGSTASSLTFSLPSMSKTAFAITSATLASAIVESKSSQASSMPCTSLGSSLTVTSVLCMMGAEGDLGPGLSHIVSPSPSPSLSGSASQPISAL